jgi:CRP-like cAMP-binding protein
MQAGFTFTRLADRLASLTELSPADLDLLAEMPSTIRDYPSHHALLRKDDEPTQCCVLLQGYLCWEDAESHDGQITSIHVPGDVPDLHTLYDRRLDGNLVTLGPAVVAFVPHRFFHELSAASASLARSLLLMLLADHAALRNWAVNLGSRDALTRVAHLFCEIAVRLQNVDLARDFRLPSPFTQSDLAAACSISPVHANRIIQELRRSGILQWQAKTITITNWPGLVRCAGFNPTYLRLRTRIGKAQAPPLLSEPTPLQPTSA